MLGQTSWDEALRESRVPCGHPVTPLLLSQGSYSYQGGRGGDSSSSARGCPKCQGGETGSGEKIGDEAQNSGPGCGLVWQQGQGESGALYLTQCSLSRHTQHGQDQGIKLPGRDRDGPPSVTITRQWL